MKKLRIGMAGTGSMSKMHLDAYRENPHVEVVAICDANKVLLEKRSAEWGIPNAYDDYKKMLASESLDALSVVTSNNMHAPISIDALNAGMHVLCEKPPAMNTAQAIKMQQTSQKNKRLLMIGFTNRYAEKIQILKSCIEKKMLGNIYYAKAAILRRCGNPGGWFSDKSLSGGGPLIDLGVHMIDLCRYLMGCPEPAAVFGHTSSAIGSRGHIKGVNWYRAANFSSDKNDVEDFACAMIKFKNKAVLFTEVSWTMNIKTPTMYVDVFGDKAGAKVHPDFEIYGEQNGYMTDLTPVLDETGLNWKKSMQAEINHFVDCIVNGAKCKSPIQDGVAIMKILDAVYESARTGNLVKIK